MVGAIGGKPAQHVLRVATSHRRRGIPVSEYIINTRRYASYRERLLVIVGADRVDLWAGCFDCIDFQCGYGLARIAEPTCNRTGRRGARGGHSGCVLVLE